ncbi:hypothetical protein ACFXEL_27905 [Streptomyces sp. NPDC059382]|uniref:hypothetical protein n=1 Tax=Streptomyces sp. NPDC059382 TaxID=3346816 RepID=UPI0036C0D5BE
MRRSAGLRIRTLPEPGHALGRDVQAQPLEAQRVAEDAALVDGAVGADLGDQGGVDEGGMEDTAAPPRLSQTVGEAAQS